MTSLSKRVALAAGLFLILWPVFAIATGIGPLMLFLVWFGAAILVGSAASRGDITTQPKKNSLRNHPSGHRPLEKVGDK